MVCNSAQWLRQVADIFAVPESANLKRFEKIDKFPERTGREEDIFSRKRQVTLGDHRKKLASQTIKRLNAVFGDILERLGYSI